MWFWWFLFVCNLIVPIIMIVAGRMMWKHSPGKINRVYGYRTKYHKDKGNEIVPVFPFSTEEEEKPIDSQ